MLLKMVQSNHMFFFRMFFNGSQHLRHSCGRCHFTYRLLDEFLTKTVMAVLSSPRKMSGWYLKSSHDRVLSDTFLFIIYWPIHRLTVLIVSLHIWSPKFMYVHNTQWTYLHFRSNFTENTDFQLQRAAG